MLKVRLPCLHYVATFKLYVSNTARGGEFYLIYIVFIYFKPMYYIMNT